MSVAIASAAGKINLALLVGAPSPDGYHPLSSVFEAVSLREFVVVEDRGAELGREPAIRVRTLLYSQVPGTTDLVFDPRETEAFSVNDGSGHLAVRAAALLACPGQSLNITVHKALPVAGGMAGGSADAAAALAAINELNGLGYSNAQLAEIAAGLGADVPACVVGGLALGLGRGDLMTQLNPGSDGPDASSRWWVAAFATEGLSTPSVFRAFDAGLVDVEGEAGPQPDIAEPLSAARLAATAAASIPGQSMDAVLLDGLQSAGVEVGDWLVNALEPTVFEMRPELLEVGETMERAGAVAWLLSGSGPTVVGMVPTEDAAQALAARVRELPHVRGAAVMWGPGRSAQVEAGLPSWAE